DLDLALLSLWAAELREHAAQLLRHVLHARGPEDLELLALLGHVDLDFRVVEQPFAQFLAESLPRGVVALRFAEARRRDEHVQDAVLGGVFRARTHLAHLADARLL